MKGWQAIEAVLESEGGVLDVRRHRTLARTAWRLARDGILVRRHPGVLTRQGASDLVRLRAASAWLQDGVICGTTALALHLDLPLEGSRPFQISCERHVGGSDAVEQHRHQVPKPCVKIQSGIRVCSLSYACLELGLIDDGATISEVLRLGLLPVTEFASAASHVRGLRGSPVMRDLAGESLLNPWSVAERRLHRILIRAGIRGWVSNMKLKIRGQVVIPDVLFEAKRLILEVEGVAFHSTLEQRQADASRQNLLAEAGYTVLRFTWSDLTANPDNVVTNVRNALRAARGK